MKLKKLYKSIERNLFSKEISHYDLIYLVLFVCISCLMLVSFLSVEEEITTGFQAIVWGFIMICSSVGIMYILEKSHTSFLPGYIIIIVGAITNHSELFPIGTTINVAIYIYRVVVMLYNELVEKNHKHKHPIQPTTNKQE